MGQRIGAYEILGELGRGAAGVVFEARDGAGRRVALKRTLHTGKDQWARAVREGEALAKLQHPNVVRVFGAGSDEQGPYLALELVEGRSLEERLEREGPLEPEAARALAIKLAGALGAVHAAGLVHRDLKPGNVLLRASDGEPLLTDFGLVRGLDGAELTRTGALVGTPSYWAPEQALGQKEIDARTDIYALGATLYAALTGGPPFQPTSLLEAIRMTTEMAPDRPSKRGPVGGALEAVVLRCLAKRPRDRYPSAEALEAALRTAVGGGPAGGRLLCVLIGVGLLVLAGLFGLATQRAPAPTPTRTVVPAPEPSRTPSREAAEARIRPAFEALAKRPDDPALQGWWTAQRELVQRVDRLEVDMVQFDSKVGVSDLAAKIQRTLEELRALRSGRPIEVAAAWRTQLTVVRAIVALDVTRPPAARALLEDLLRRVERVAPTGPGARAIRLTRVWSALAHNKPVEVRLEPPEPTAPYPRYLYRQVGARTGPIAGHEARWRAADEALAALRRGPVTHGLRRRFDILATARLLIGARESLVRGQAPSTDLLVHYASRAYREETPRRSYTMERLACALVMAGRFTEARKMAREVVKQFQPNLWTTVAVEARCDESQGRLDRALKRLSRALTMAKGGTMILRAGLTRVWILQGDPKWDRDMPTLERHSLEHMPWLDPLVLRRLAREQGR